jgi:hypothetical protein
MEGHPRVRGGCHEAHDTQTTAKYRVAGPKSDQRRAGADK